MILILTTLGLLDPINITSVSTPYQAKIAKTAINFSRFFKGATAHKARDSRNRVSFPNPTFNIRSPIDLLQANLTLKDYSEHMTSGNLFPSQTGEPTEIQRLCLTQTKFLDPFHLSQMTNGNISIEEALLLIPCLGLQKNSKQVSVCDPATGNSHKDFQPGMLTSKVSHKLIFLDPNVLLKMLPETVYDVDKDYKDVHAF